MRICIVGPSMKFASGISYHTVYLANSLSKDNDVAVINFRNILPRFMYPGKVRVGEKVTDIKFSESIKIQEMDYNNPITWIKSYRYLKQFKPDVVVLQWWSASVAHMHLLVKLFSRLVGTKVAIEFHEVVDPFENSILPIRIYAREVGRLLRSGASMCITHSESDKRLVVERYNIPEKNIYVMPLGLYSHYKVINKDIARKILSIDDDYVILAFGLIRKYKGIQYLIRAYESLPTDIINHSRLMIVGEVWEDKEALLREINESKAFKQITLIDKYVSDGDASKYFSAASVVVLPYIRASQSGVAHIAMSFGKPIIASQVGGLSESLCDYPGTRFVQPANIAELSHRLSELRDCSTLYESSARKWEDLSKDYLKVLCI